MQVTHLQISKSPEVVRINLTLDVVDREHIKKVADNEGVTLAEFVRGSIAQRLDELKMRGRITT